MRISLKNIGIISDADVEINGITVIAGENGTGKSTVGRALYATFNGLHDIDDKIRNEKFSSICTSLENLFFNFASGEKYHLTRRQLSESILDDIDNKAKNNKIMSLVNEFVKENEIDVDEMSKDPLYVKIMGQIQEVINMPEDTSCRIIVDRNIGNEFGNQIGNVLREGSSSISIAIKDETTTIIISDNRVEKIVNIKNIKAEAIYLDDPFAIDNNSRVIFSLRTPGRRNAFSALEHRESLRKKIFSETDDRNIIDEFLANEKLSMIDRLVSSACQGDLVLNDDQTLEYVVGDKYTLNAYNLSTGLKTFAILKKLLKNGDIQYNGTVILDEPEIHLHPKWQLLLAEIIVLLHKEFNLHVLLNTHSPYFLRAIEVFSYKHNVQNKCKYYSSERNEFDNAVITDVTGNVEVIYKKLADPLQTLEDIGGDIL